jgi:hypothetical protein
MSWSVGSTGELEGVKRELRKQIHENDSYVGQPEPHGMSTAENLLRRQACTLLLSALEAQKLPPADSGSYLAPYKHVEAKAWGSESRDSEGHCTQSVHVSVSMVVPAA